MSDTPIVITSVAHGEAIAAAAAHLRALQDPGGFALVGPAALRSAKATDAFTEQREGQLRELLADRAQKIAREAMLEDPKLGPKVLALSSATNARGSVGGAAAIAPELVDRLLGVEFPYEDSLRREFAGFALSAYVSIFQRDADGLWPQPKETDPPPHAQRAHELRKADHLIGQIASRGLGVVLSRDTRSDL